ncbi:hypothetical protein Mmc1_2111 [Magnetococcus marinus MC-1]|uniref:Uncharacterized protein n=1 Tax=Magnetococcus marinus (strain ATCC BAA-1437 / JCM 17883 / MC-1) TaxID=156889 RepID=A0L9G9_MAGMM|nr:hypothetical protein [Magnetococcus marinus]ABK44612.1 hypothetical protein Mmc1_2111 [Magnetococcus marinus MC-1]
MSRLLVRLQTWSAAALLLIMFPMPSVGYTNHKISPSEVYTQAVQIEKELAILSKYFIIPGKPELFEPFIANLQPRHVWQKSYFILVKLNLLRSKHGLPTIPPSAIQPVQQLDPVLVYEQTQRILTEIAIIKKRLGVDEKVSPAKAEVGKQPTDVFNKLHQISLAIDKLNHAPISPSSVFAEAMRVYEDVNTLISHLQLDNTTFPPAKLENITPMDSMDATFGLIKEIQRLQRDMVIPRTDFTSFKNQRTIEPADVFNMVGMCLAELQTIKAALDLSTEVTPQAKFYTNKKPADVHQLIRWITRKLQQIQTVR